MNEEMEKIAEYERGQRVRSTKCLLLLFLLLTKRLKLLLNFCIRSLRLMVKRILPGTFWTIHAAVDQFLRQIAKRGAADTFATGVDWILKMLRLELRQRKSGRLETHYIYILVSSE